MKIPQINPARLCDVCLLSDTQQLAIENGATIRGKQIAGGIPYQDAARVAGDNSNDKWLAVIYAAGTKKVLNTI